MTDAKSRPDIRVSMQEDRFAGRPARPWRTPLVLAIILSAGVAAWGKDSRRPAASRQPKVQDLDFKAFFEVSGSGLKPSASLLALIGQRVKLVGFMAKMEAAPKGGFYLTPRPVSCDEEGGGTADLPPEAVFVRVRSSAGRDIPWSPRALEVTGLLDVGYHEEDDGRVTHIRLLLDQPQDLLGAVPKR